MNRRDRRAARSQDRAGGHAGDPQTSRLFRDALRLHQAGRLSEAADLYREIIAVEPTHLGSLQNLGAIAVDAQLHPLAIELFRRAIALNDAVPDYHRNIAIALSVLGQFDDAIHHARRAIALKPAEIGAYLILGDVLEKKNQVTEALHCYEDAARLEAGSAAVHLRLGQLQLRLGLLTEADTSLGRALALAPQSAATLFYLGNLRAQQGQPQSAVDSYLRSIEIDPERLETHLNLCAALMAQSKYPEAIAHYQQILAYKPDFVDGYRSLATAYLVSNDPLNALETARQALRLAETSAGKSLVAASLLELANATLVPRDAEMAELFIRAISEPWGRPDQLMGYGIKLVRADADIAACIDRAVAAWPAHLSSDELFGPTGFSAVSHQQVLRCMLENGLIGNLGIERFLTNARLCLLQTATASSPGDVLAEESLGFYAALSRQCFINEYVYAQTDQEQIAVEKLRGALASALRARSPFPVLWLVACAAYAPLHALAGSETLLEQPWPEAVDGVLTQQIREPLEERRLRDTIPRLTPIEDAVSVRVRDQYEENPYPRWIKSPVPSVRLGPDPFIRQSFPFAKFRNLDKAGDIDFLTAGCGTGQQLMDKSQAIVGAHCLAVDLSLSSLCYAKRKTDALGIRNIEFGHADILRLDALGRSFDIIECGGVLHHLGDPEAGWRVLVSLLRPNGFMRVALYSELARARIVAAQKLAAGRGVDQTADDIRRFRQEFLANPDAGMVRNVTSVVDFFSTSTCRDLLFHVQEHRFTLPRIKTFIEANDLQCIGIEVPSPVRSRYAEQFPEDAAMNDLDRWHRFEEQYPDTFIGMYQFWVQKGAGGQNMRADAA
jgi:tetratricopeptide (TPR) repeat protein/2-polyprenyl-3-methyl-5-hydroxy-6-metoxy-1,4-benzoquinol methylase